ncbi:uncharacterized protein BXZ73DRAFT_23121, partial [Epithele typhae]|uniref:uncharacterized protein n=1 Tax=Epithele typhae TaxID=378194 RepID=UPI0020081416
LEDSKHVTKEEQLAIFLRLARTGLGQREAREQFQRSPETVSIVFNRILDMLVSPRFYHRYVKLPDPSRTPRWIKDNPKFYPFFRRVLGAIDGTHVDAF